MKNLLIISICFIIITGCKKDYLDYRSRYTGDYSFLIHQHTAYGTSSIFYTNDTTFISYGKIKKGYESEIILISSPHFSLQVTIYEDGTLEGKDNNGIGEFISKNKIKYFWAGLSPAGGTRYNITGEKQ